MRKINKEICKKELTDTEQRAIISYKLIQGNKRGK